MSTEMFDRRSKKGGEKKGDGVYFGPTHAKLMPGLFSLAGADEGREEEGGSSGM